MIDLLFNIVAASAAGSVVGVGICLLAIFALSPLFEQKDGPVELTSPEEGDYCRRQGGDQVPRVDTEYTGTFGKEERLGLRGTSLVVTYTQPWAGHAVRRKDGSIIRFMTPEERQRRSEAAKKANRMRNAKRRA